MKNDPCIFRYVGRGGIAAAFIALLASAGCQSMHPPRAYLSRSARMAVPQGPARLREVSLFPNGIGTFQYQGRVNGDAAETLEFRSAQIDDVLGSMIFQDTGGGQVGEITYPTKIPLDEQLRQFPVNLTGSPSRASILGQMRGAKVTFVLKHPYGKRITGRIVSLRYGRATDKSRPSPLVIRVGQAEHSPNRSNTRDVGIDLLCHGTLRHITLDDVRLIVVRDAALRQSLAKAMTLLSYKHRHHVRPLTVWFRGHSSRTVGFAYLMETPVWRMTYRLILPAPGDTRQKSVVQAMALVTNDSNTDWNNIRLDLRGGEPVSFIAHLYRPLYQRRPVRQASSELKRSPQTWGGAAYQSRRPGILSRHLYHQLRRQRGTPTPTGTAGVGTIGGGGSIFQQSGQQSGQQLQKLPSVPFNPLQGVKALAGTSMVYPAFDYHMDDLSLQQGHSALVPILVTPIAAKTADYFTAYDFASVVGGTHHPLKAVRLTNNSAHYLPPGTTSIYQGAVLAGQAVMPALPPGAHRTLKFAVDRSVGIRIHADTAPPSRLITMAIDGGVLYERFTDRAPFRLTVVNSGSTKKTVLIRTGVARRLMVQRRLLSAGRHRRTATLQLDLMPQHRESFPLAIRSHFSQTVSLAGSNADQIKQLMDEYPKMPPKIRAAIKGGYNLQVRLQTTKSKAVNLQAALASVKSITTQLETSLTSMKKAGKAYDKAAAVLNHETGIYIQLTNELTAQKQIIEKATKAVARYWQKEKIKTTPLG